MASGDVAICLDLSAGGRATSWRVGDLELLGSNNGHPVANGMYPMAPWAGRLRGNRCEIDGNVHTFPVNFEGWAIHGTIFTEQVEVVEVTESAATCLARLRCALQPPWSGWVEMLWKLDERCLHTEIEVLSEGPTFPADVGWHPWFNRSLNRGGLICGGLAEWELPGAALATRDAEGLLSGNIVPLVDTQGPYDDAFHVPAATGKLTWPGALSLTIVNSHPWFVVYDELVGFVLVEPQTGPPNGISEPVIGSVNMVSPDRPLLMVTDWWMTREWLSVQP